MWRKPRPRCRCFTPTAAGNGSLMRTGPVALVHRGDDEQLVIAATAMSELTHPHPDAVDACVLWTVAIDRAIANGTIEGPRAGLHLIDESRRAFWEQTIDRRRNEGPSRVHTERPRRRGPASGVGRGPRHS